MSTKLTQVIAENYRLFVRGFAAIFGCIAVWWGIVEFPVFFQEAAAESVASQVIAGDPFKTEILARQIITIDDIEKRSAYCRPKALRSTAIIQLRRVETSTFPSDRGYGNEQMDSLNDAVRSSLACSPADPFLWLVLYWIDSTHRDLRPVNFEYLRMSYQLGANEGWIGVKRSRLAFTEFDRLPADLAESLINEFLGLIESGFSQQAAEIFTGPAWPERELILSRMSRRVSNQNHQLFANALYSRGYDVNVPGVVRRDLSPRH